MKWNAYGLASIGSGCMILAGYLWWQRPNPAVMAQDAAECVAACAERVLIPALSGTAVPDTGATSVTNLDITTNFWTRVEFQKISGGSAFHISPSSFSFNQDQVAQVRSFAFSIDSSAAFGDASTWNLLKNGSVVGSISLSVPAAGQSTEWSGAYSDSELAVNPVTVRIYAGGQYSGGQCFISSAPTGNATYTTNVFEIETTPAANYRVDNYFRFAPIHAGADALRARVISPWSAGDTGGHCWWVDTEWDIADGDALSSDQGLSYAVVATNQEGYIADGVTYPALVTLGYSSTAGAEQNVRATDSRGRDDGARFWHFPQTGWSRPVQTTVLPHLYPLRSAPLTNAPPWSWEGGNWWTHVGMGTNIYYYPWERQTSTNADYDTVATCAAWPATNNLEAVRRLAGKCVRTFAILPVSAASVSNGVQVSYVGWATNNLGGTSGTEPSYPSPEQVDPTESWTDTVTSVSAMLAEEKLQFHWQAGADYVDSPNGYSWDKSVYISYTAMDYRGVSLPWPCDYALASNCVSRIRIFGVFYNAPMIDADGSVASARDTGSYSAAWYSQIPDDHAFGLGYHTQTLPSGFPSDDAATQYLFDPSWINAGTPSVDNAGTVVSLLADVSSPSSRPLFDLGGKAFCRHDAIAQGKGNEWRWQTQSEYEDSEGKKHTAYSLTKSSDRLYRQSLWLAYFVVVVDWNWQHLNESNPFNPAPYYPPWMGK